MSTEQLEKHQFQPATYVCSTWFERDRSHIRLETGNGKLVFELWDDDVHDAIVSGYLPRPRSPRPTDADWLDCALSYARDMELIDRSSYTPGPPRPRGA